MEIIKGIEIIDLALYLSDFDSLIFSDFHVGYEEMLNKKGVLVPRFQFKDIIDRLGKILKKKYKRIIVNGDLKHEFGYISEQEWRDSLKLLDYLGRHCEELVLIKGNHDTILGPIAKKRNLKIVEHFVLGDVLICHGDKIIKKEKIKTIVIGHEHPAVSLQESARVETFKCFLVGSWERKKLIVMPSFNLLSEGTDVVREKKLSPYLKKYLGNFEVFVVSDKVYDFGKLKGLRKSI
ncbi:metallophosphoesterase [Candidatus Woesearchaeota archaeon]|nr:metallophosphoesterase [Candidatus Woesearchaeota archaeon]